MEWNRTSVRLRGFGIRQLTPWEEGIVVGTISPNWINYAQFYARSVQKRTTKRAAAFGINHVRGEVLTLVAMVSPFFCPTWKQLELIPTGMFCFRCKPGVLYYLESVTCFVWRTTGILRRVISCWNTTIDRMKRRKDTNSQIMWLGFVEELCFNRFVFCSIHMFLYSCPWTNSTICVFFGDSTILMLNCLLPGAYLCRSLPVVF